jgi:hypothetical protein
MASVLLFVFFLLSHFVLLLPAQGKMIYTERCPPFRCGHLGDIHFPFTNETNPECGVLTVDCRDDQHPTIQLEDGGSRPHEVLNISQNNTMSSIRIVDIEFSEQLKFVRCESLTNLTLTDFSFISFEIATPNQTFFKCNSAPDIPPPLQSLKKRAARTTLISTLVFQAAIFPLIILHVQLFILRRQVMNLMMTCLVF